MSGRCDSAVKKNSHSAQLRKQPSPSPHNSSTGFRFDLTMTQTPLANDVSPHTHTGVHSSYRSGQEEVNSDSAEKASSKPPQESDRPPFSPFSAFTCFSLWLRSAQQKNDQEYDFFLGQNGKINIHLEFMRSIVIRVFNKHQWIWKCQVELGLGTMATILFQISVPRVYQPLTLYFHVIWKFWTKSWTASTRYICESDQPHRSISVARQVLHLPTASVG